MVVGVLAKIRHHRGPRLSRGSNHVAKVARTPATRQPVNDGLTVVAVAGTTLASSQRHSRRPSQRPCSCPAASRCLVVVEREGAVAEYPTLTFHPPPGRRAPLAFVRDSQLQGPIRLCRCTVAVVVVVVLVAAAAVVVTVVVVDATVEPVRGLIAAGSLRRSHPPPQRLRQRPRQR